MVSNNRAGNYRESWICDTCRRRGTGDRWFCAQCHADLCFSCSPLQLAAAGADAWQDPSELVRTNTGSAFVVAATEVGAMSAAEQERRAQLEAARIEDAATAEDALTCAGHHLSRHLATGLSPQSTSVIAFALFWASLGDKPPSP